MKVGSSPKSSRSRATFWVRHPVALLVLLCGAIFGLIRAVSVWW